MHADVSNSHNWQALYPFASQGIDLDGLNYHYLDEGQGEAVVMVHGNPTWSFYFRNLINGLKDSYRVIVPDHIGCGLSDKPQDYPYTLEQHIDNLEQLLINHLKLDKITLVLHDWGGAIGMGFAVRHPETISRIVILNTAAFLSPHCPWRIRLCKLPVFGTIAVRGFNAFARAAVHMATSHHERFTSQVKAGYLAPYNSYRNRIATLRFVQDIPLGPEHPTWKTVSAIQKKLHLFEDLPIMICWGERDFCFNHEFLKVWTQYFPKAQTHTFKDAGHYVLEDAHERILPLIKCFLTSAGSD